MTAIRKMLYAVKDPDPRRETALPKAVALAKSCGASLELFHAISAPLLLPTESMSGASIEDLKRDAVELQRLRLEKLAASVRGDGVEIGAFVTWDYPPHEAIVRRAEEIGADLIVAPCHKGPRGKAWLVRLTDFELLRVSAIPVLLLKSAAPYRRPVVVAAVDPGHAHAKPLDLDSQILAEARSMAETLRGALHAIHVNHPPVYGLAWGEPLAAGTAVARMLNEFEKIDRETFDDFMADSGIPAKRRHRVDGHPALVIPRLARELGAGLVVMGAVSRSGLKRVFIGNTAERVLGDLPCDVLVVKPRDFVQRVPVQRSGAVVLTHAPVGVLAS